MGTINKYKLKDGYAPSLDRFIDKLNSQEKTITNGIYTNREKDSGHL